jgi:ATP-binding cassette subfamily F protein uup
MVLGNISQILLDYHAISHALSEHTDNMDELLIDSKICRAHWKSQDGWSIASKNRNCYRQA